MQHTESRQGRQLRGSLSRKLRAILCLGIFAAPAAVGTMAYWTDEATIQTGELSTGTLDLTVGATPENSGYLPGPGGVFEYSDITISNLLPDESIARPFAVRNSGDAAFTYNGSVFTTNNDLVASGSGLHVEIFRGGEPVTVGDEEDGNRSGTCPGGVSLKDQAVSTSTNNVNVAPNDILLAPGEAQAHCVRIWLHPDSPNTLQRKITELTIKLNAKQVNVP